MAARLFPFSLALVGLTGPACAQPSTLTPPVTPADLAAAMQAVPTPATVSPPATDIGSKLGTDAHYARADHTHATSVQSARMTVAVAGQPVRWAFDKPFDAGVVPVVTCTAQNVSGATRPFVVNTVGDPTATYADLIVFQAAQPTVSVLGASVTLFGPASAGTVVNCQAARPTQ